MSLHPVTRLIAVIRTLTRSSLAAVGLWAGPDPHMAQLRPRYRDAVAALPHDQRTVFTLHRIQGLSIADIAARLDMPSSQVEELLAAALLAIAAALEAPR